MIEKNKHYLNCILPGSGVGVTVGDSLSAALSVFKRMYKEAGIVNELHSRKEFVKRSVRRRKQVQDAIYKQRKSK